MSQTERKEIDRALVVAVKKGATDQIAQLLAQGADIETLSKGLFDRGATLIDLALARQNTDALRALLDAGANPNLSGAAYLCTAAGANYVEGIEALLAAGAKPDAKNSEGRTAFMVAATGLYPRAAAALVKGGADVLLEDKNGFTGFESAVWKSFNWVRTDSNSSSINSDRANKVLRFLHDIKSWEEAQRAKAAKPNMTVDQDSGQAQVTFKRTVSGSVLEDTFDFVARERISILRKAEGGAVESMTIQSFDDLQDSSVLSKAFDAYARRGGVQHEAGAGADMKKGKGPSLKL